MASSQKQKGIVTYALSANRQRPLAGAASAAVFNTYRRCKAQFLYVVPPFVFAWWIMAWATEKYVYPVTWDEEKRQGFSRRNGWLTLR
ncbi:MAG: hypothetical protein Q9200_007583 [Gallowayella weberi]